MNNLPKVVAQQRRGRASNPRLLDRKFDALPLSHRATPLTMQTLLSTVPPTSKKLQRMQTSAARVVLPNLSKLPSTVLFFELHWLPDNSSITVELACLTYKLLTTGHLLVSAHAATPLHPYTHSMVN